MRAVSLAAKGGNHAVHAFGRVLNAVEQIVRALSFEALVDREGFQTGEADEIGVPDPLNRDTVSAQQFSLNLGDIVQIEDTRRMRNVQG